VLDVLFALDSSCNGVVSFVVDEAFNVIFLVKLSANPSRYSKVRRIKSLVTPTYNVPPGALARM
jgi:hypothetical protein